ncbi:VOC family protein [Flavobacterium sp. F-65]|uniref:VOC family protein n=1 Tax=Flavobacterium pisciphilum TaxID=2893755 RepID=A0ABS8MZ80_9FLAO|nr:VOC family protein [Flavobacterium sp. F-65]MCC9074075.1 VOC family protein [Flavobacterium sp. F-65]
MKTLIPYFTISQRCEEALRFYEFCFDGQVIFEQKYQETNYQTSEKFKSKIAHAEFKADAIHFYVSDGFENEQASFGNAIGMTINFSDKQEQLNVFNRLKAGGQITLDFSTTSINSQLVSLIDKFGITWYLNHQNPLTE